MTGTTSGNGSGNDTGPPFERHRVYYFVLKLCVLALAAYLAVKLLGLW